VIIPLECFCSMLFLSRYVWKIFAWLMCWAVGNYFYFRWMHLRFHRINFYTTHRLNDAYMYWWGCAIGVVAAQVPLWGFRSELLFDFFEGSREVFSSTQAKILVVLVTYFLAVLLWLSAYHFIVRRRKSEANVWAEKPALRRSQSLAASHSSLANWKDKTLHEVKMHSVYSWLNTNPVFVLKCKYFFKDPDGQDTEHRKKHPLASGQDEEVVCFFEVGKEYLFLRPERLHLLDATISDSLEPEYWIDEVASRLGQLTDLLSEKVDERTGNARLSVGYQPIDPN